MKKAIRILLPILLILTIVLSSIWYLFVYDREFTRDLLLSGARFFESEGNHNVAQWFYNLAYNQDHNNDAVAIELAEQYKEHGNYTKAEYTLYKAIQDGGGIDLYIALSKTYIEQDKILDAVNLINNVTGDIKKELERRRPNMPTVSPDPDFYSQYISVTVSCSSGTLYVTTSAPYPSVTTDRYTAPVVLQEGENKIVAIAISDEGLVSPLAVYGYTIGGVIEEITFADPAIEAIIRKQLNVGDKTVLYTNDLWNITEFTVPAEAKDYSDLKYLTYLEKLTIHDGISGQISHISGMSHLKVLDIQNTSVSNDELEIIGSFAKMETLTLKNCSLSTTAPLSSLSEIIYLDLSNNTIRDLSGLSNMSSLQELNLQRNVVNDLGALSNCSLLTKLDVSYNAVPSLSPLYGLSSLVYLDAAQNNITSIIGIDNLPNLQNLYVSYNQLTDISPVASCNKLVELGVGSNQLTDISSLSTLNTLMYLDFSHNEVSELPAWSKTCSLVTIEGSYNLITNLEPLRGLDSLNNVYFDYNPELASIAPLAECHRLIRVHVFGTKVKDVTALTDQSIIVNYDPTK